MDTRILDGWDALARAIKRIETASPFRMSEAADLLRTEREKFESLLLLLAKDTPQ